MTKAILIVDDDSDLVHVLSKRCEGMGLEVFRSSDAMHGLLDVYRDKPDLVLLDIDLPSGNGLGICEMLRSDPQFEELPVIIMSGHEDADVLHRCQTLGANFVPKGPDFWERIKPLICELLDFEPARSETASLATAASTDTCMVKPSRPKVLCIDDDPDISKVIKIRLESFGVDVNRAFNGMQGYWTALDFHPDVIITDLNMPDGEGNYIVGRFKSNSLTANIPIIVLTGQVNPAMKRMMFTLGVSQYLTKPLIFEELLRECRRHLDLPEKPLRVKCPTS